MECVNIHSDSGKGYKIADCAKADGIYKVVFPKNFNRLLIEYQEHPESKSLAPDGTPCEADTSGLLHRAHVIAGKLRYVGQGNRSKMGGSPRPRPLALAPLPPPRETRVAPHTPARPLPPSLARSR